ncbi:MAG: MFS transporter [Clostridia bacterium]|nr:MFS transporter [Clostridia bacterium]
MRDLNTKNRRYVGTKETVAYVLDDIAQSFNIDYYRSIYIINILKIGLNFQKTATFIMGIWDIINDLLVASVVDKTRTRWGKFKPWLMIYAVPGVSISILFWLLPNFFGGSGLYYAPKLAAYLILQLLHDLAHTVITIARTGMTATITPNIAERTSLITKANLLSGFVEKAPQIVMGFLMDFIDRGIIKIDISSLYVSAGITVTAVSGVLAFIYALVAKERVMQSEEKPAVKGSMKAIITNKPMLLIVLSEFLGAFSVSGDLSLYYRDVLGFSSMATIVGIPGAFVSPMSYSYVSWARKRFSTKLLWIAGSHVDNLLLSGVFIVGCFNKNYKKLGAMIPAWMIRETIWMMFYGIMKVIPSEMKNEAIDYGEWKNGYRSEGMTGAAKEISAKLVKTFRDTLQTAILSKIGYVQGAVSGTQSEKTEFALFAMCTIVPIVTGLLSIIPKLFYDLSGEKLEKMYEELNERRRLAALQTQEMEQAL